MSTDVTMAVVIKRPRAEVAAYLFDPAHDAVWTTGVISVRPLTEGRLRAGPASTGIPVGKVSTSWGFALSVPRGGGRHGRAASIFPHSGWGQRFEKAADRRQGSAAVFALPAQKVCGSLALGCDARPLI